MITKKTGMKRIENVVATFDKMVNDLETGIDEVNAKIETNESLIEDIREENANLTASRVQAASLMNGIRKLMK